MKNLKLISLMASLLLLFTINAVYALRFGNDLINVGDLKSKVYTICGEPVTRDIIGYIDYVESGKRIRVMKIEEWLIEVPILDAVYNYSLVFEGNKLKEITSLGKKK
jgi:hypothetical protein